MKNEEYRKQGELHKDFPESEDEWDLVLCKKCGQMTNHEGDKCLKCNKIDSNSEGESITGENSDFNILNSKTPSTKPAPSETFDSIIKDLENGCKWEWEKNGGTHDYWGLKGRLETAKQLREIVEKAIEDLQTNQIEDDGLDVETADYWINAKELRKALGVDSE